MAYCENCGTKLKEGAKFCTNCGTPVNNTNNSKGNLHIKWEGQWALIDQKIYVIVNGDKIGEYSFKKGFQTTVPITQQTMVIEIKLSIRKSKNTFSLTPDVDYYYELLYNNTMGNFDYRLTDSNGMIIR